jgi:hypothetical protein
MYFYVSVIGDFRPAPNSPRVSEERLVALFDP